MTSGRKSLHRLDASIAEARRALADASDSIAADARAATDLDREQLDAFSRFADIRLDIIRENDTTGALQAIDRKAAALIAKHDDVIASLQNRRETIQETLRKLERDRRAGEEALDAAIQRHDNESDATRERLKENDAYKTLNSAAEEAKAIAARARQKLDTARETREEKGAPYEDDPLFSYLYDRKFGAKDYRAFPLFALLDRWVAGLIRYRDARLNYDRLLELPERLAEHVTFVDASAAEAQERLARFEQDALISDGVDALRREAEAARKKLEEIDAHLTSTEAQEQDLASEIETATAGQSGPLADARSLISQALQRRSIPDLKILAQETESRIDDQIVGELISLKRQSLELEENRDANARSVRRNKELLSDLEDLRRRFKRSKFDSPYSDFSGRDVVGVLVGELARGLLSRDEVWRRLRRAHRMRSRDWNGGFGGNDWRGGFGLPDDWTDVAFPRTGRRRGGVTWPQSPRPPRRAPRPPRLPKTRLPRTRATRRGKGGFRTGGGF